MYIARVGTVGVCYVDSILIGGFFRKKFDGEYRWIVLDNEFTVLGYVDSLAHAIEYLRGNTEDS